MSDVFVAPLWLGAWCIYWVGAASTLWQTLCKGYPLMDRFDKVFTRLLYVFQKAAVSTLVTNTIQP